MCAIFGFSGFKDDQLLKKMGQILSHRGPDDQGFYIDEQISLGHRRLSIIDLSSGGHQPFLSEDKQKVLSANGEIYNFRSLKEVLEREGHRFFGQSDNEVILHAYEEWGRDFVQKLVGIFAFALWNKSEKTLILVRDHLGVKPLYYAYDNKFLVFASETKAILAWEKIKREIDPVSLDYYLSLRYVPGTRTMFSQIKRLPPGSILFFRNGGVKIEKYWEPKIRAKKLKEKETGKQLRNLLENSVSSQMVSDVPLGTYLSGGLDSSVITALAQEQTRRPLKTFSVSFGGTFDETGEAKQVSRFLKTSYHQFSILKKDILLLPKIVSFLDEPIGDPIIIPYFFLAKFARRKVKVVLTGDGADEIFGGYIHYLGIYWKEKLFSSFFWGLLASIIPSKIIDRIFPYPSSAGDKGKERLIQFLEASSLWEEFFSFAALFSADDKKRLYSPSFLEKLKGGKTIEQEVRDEFKGGKGDSLSRIIKRDIKFWLPDYILLMADRLSMTHGLELRVPYLDYRLVEFALSLPSSFKIRGLVNKYVLRKAVGGFLPKEVLARPKKAFFVPLEQFLGKGFNQLVSSTLSRKKVKKRGLFNQEYIEYLVGNIEKSPLLLGKQLAALVILELWCQHYLDDENF